LLELLLGRLLELLWGLLLELLLGRLLELLRCLLELLLGQFLERLLGRLLLQLLLLQRRRFHIRRESYASKPPIIHIISHGHQASGTLGIAFFRVPGVGGVG
jgi:hypothetical protein